MAAATKLTGLTSTTPQVEPKPSNLSSTLMPVVVALMIVIAFMVGALWQKVSSLEKGGVNVAGVENNDAQPSAAQPSLPADPTVPVKADTLNIPPITEKDHIRGDRNTKLTWIEYSDLECPFCKRIHPDLQKLVNEYDGELRWVYRHFPLASIHSKAPKEAEAAECAAAAGGNEAFWKYIDRLFEITPANNGLDETELPKIAQYVGLNSYSFKRCLKDGQYKTKVDEDYAGGSRAGVNGTPGSFLLDDKGNAWVINGALPYDSLKNIVGAARKS